MISAGRISVGCRVEGCYGPLVPNPNPNVKRRVRDRVVGTVVQAAGQHKWVVQFDFDGKVKTVASSGLKIVPQQSAIPLDELAEVRIILLFLLLIVVFDCSNLSFLFAGNVYFLR